MFPKFFWPGDVRNCEQLRPGKTVIGRRFYWQGPVLFALFAVAAFAAVIFGLRSYHSFLLLHSAHRLGASDVGSVRAWMTLQYVAGSYHVSETALIQRLGLSSAIDNKTTLKSIAQQRHVSPFQYIQQVQEAIAELRSVSPPFPLGIARTPGTLEDEFLAALLIYGYPVLGLTLLLSTMGAPFPSALSVVVAGSLIAREQMTWFWASVVVVSCSAAGDSAGYGLGRVLGREFLERRGRWVGFTPVRWAQAELIFQRWGVLCVLLSRSLISFLSSAVNLLAGASRYRLRVFLPTAIVGRLIWSSAYLGLGYGFGVAIEAAADFTSSLSGLLVSLVVLTALGIMIHRNHASLTTAKR